MRKATAKQISDLRKRSAAINYSNLSVNELGELLERGKKIDYEKLLDERIVAGYGVLWSSVNSHKERFVKGAFSKSIKELGPGTNSTYEIKFRDEHGRVCSLFAELVEDEVGLFFKSKPLDNVQWANDLLVQLKSRSINNFSIGFNYVWDKIEYDENEDCLVLLEVRLYEISAVAIPSDINTFAMRSAEEIEYIEDDVEDFVLSLPPSRRLDARKIFSRYKSLVSQEPIMQERTSLEESQADDEPKKKIDYDFLTNKFTL